MTMTGILAGWYTGVTGVLVTATDDDDWYTGRLVYWCDWCTGMTGILV